MSAPLSAADWKSISADPDFQRLLAAKRRFLVPATIFFIVYYLALPISVGYFPEIMKQPVWGRLNWAYLFALSQFLMTWIMAGLYVSAARRWDQQSAALVAKLLHR